MLTRRSDIMSNDLQAAADATEPAITGSRSVATCMTELAAFHIMVSFPGNYYMST